MTEEQIKKLAIRNAVALEKVPVEFQSVISSMAYDRGHSAGSEEVTNYIESYVDDLLPAIKAFHASIEANCYSREL